LAAGAPNVISDGAFGAERTGTCPLKLGNVGRTDEVESLASNGQRVLISLRSSGLAAANVSLGVAREPLELTKEPPGFDTEWQKSSNSVATNVCLGLTKDPMKNCNVLDVY